MGLASSFRSSRRLGPEYHRTEPPPCPARGVQVRLVKQRTRRQPNKSREVENTKFRYQSPLLCCGWLHSLVAAIPSVSASGSRLVDELRGAEYIVSTNLLRGRNMTANRFAVSPGVRTVTAGLVFLSGSTVAAADASDCKLTVAAAATALGVQTARANASQGHSKMPPDNMDVVTCGYAEATRDPRAKVLTYTLYTPVAADLSTVFLSLAHPNIPGNPQAFSPGLGSESTGWVRGNADGVTFDGGVAFRMPSSIVVIRVGMMPSAAAAQAALASAGAALAKS
jgi:hypothetical protein